MVVRGERVPGSAIVAAHWAGWAGVTIVVMLFAGI